MGQEIESAIFQESDFETFYRRLEEETRLLQEMMHSGTFSNDELTTGFEVEAWLIDHDMRASPSNESFLKEFNEPLAFPELARFNIELNTVPVEIGSEVLTGLSKNLKEIWQRTALEADKSQLELLMIGILPTIEKALLNIDNMTRLNRYRALNEQILRTRGEPIHLDIVGKEHLKYDHNDVMLESAATSFQLHLKVPVSEAVRYYNAAIMTSFATVAVSANSPFLFGKNLWEETRIPLFEQAVETGGYRDAAHGPLHRVSFGTGYARETLFECFQENLEHYPVLLPRLFDSPLDRFDHLRLHNGTIWRWNRPLVGFDENGSPHIRIEHRVIPSGPSIVDMITNAAFSYGLIEGFRQAYKTPVLAFAEAKDNFYQAARHGLDASMIWKGGSKVSLAKLLLDELIPLAREGLLNLGVTRTDIDFYLELLHERVCSGQTGAKWQRGFIEQNPGAFANMTAVYLAHQKTGEPVHTWNLK